MLVKESITNYKNFRWFWINLAFFSILLVFYLLDEPLAGRGGDTFIGQHEELRGILNCGLRPRSSNNSTVESRRSSVDGKGKTRRGRCTEQ